MRRDWCELCIDSPAGTRWLCPNAVNHGSVAGEDVRISELGQEIVGLYVQVNVPEIRENTSDMAAHEGEFGRIHGDEFNFIPVEVDLESGEQVLFWRDCLIVVEGSRCAECSEMFRGIDYLCPECRS